MKLSKKCQYALQAVFELASRNTGKPVKTVNIAKAQNVSVRFMEVILNELKHGGFVESKRGNVGGYMLLRDAKGLTVGEIIRFVQGPISVAGSNGADNRRKTGSEAAFGELWSKANNAISNVFDEVTFDEMVEVAKKNRDTSVLNYMI